MFSAWEPLCPGLHILCVQLWNDIKMCSQCLVSSLLLNPMFTFFLPCLHVFVRDSGCRVTFCFLVLFCFLHALTGAQVQAEQCVGADCVRVNPDLELRIRPVKHPESVHSLIQRLRCHGRRREPGSLRAEPPSLPRE